jgi:hypothetical protein
VFNSVAPLLTCGRDAGACVLLQLLVGAGAKMLGVMMKILILILMT